MMPSDRVDQIQAFVSHVILDDEDADDDASMQPRHPAQALDTDKGESPVDTGTTVQGDEGAMTTFGMQDLVELHVILNDFIQDCQSQHQGLTYCGVNAHFQNSSTEKKIHDLQEQTRTMMLHGLRKWSSMLSVHLWPYGLQMANDICNSTPCKRSDISPIELLSGVTICPKLKHYHSFGCPTYVLDKELQAQKSLPKWRSIARLGIHLGHHQTTHAV